MRESGHQNVRKVSWWTEIPESQDSPKRRRTFLTKIFDDAGSYPRTLDPFTRSYVLLACYYYKDISYSGLRTSNYDLIGCLQYIANQPHTGTLLDTNITTAPARNGRSKMLLSHMRVPTLIPIASAPANPPPRARLSDLSRISCVEGGGFCGVPDILACV